MYEMQKQENERASQIIRV